MKKYNLFLISCLTGLLLGLGWPKIGSPILLFIAFVPLLWVENYIAQDKTKRFSKFAGLYYSYVPFLIWNVIDTYWVWYSTPIAIVAFLLNALFMASFFQLFHYTRTKLYKSTGAYFVLPLYWITFEYIHMNWEASWPWLTLGNGFATMPYLIQWYEYTGVFGGTLWIFLSNILATKLLIACLKKQRSSIAKNTLALACIIVIPITASLIRYYTYSDPENAYPVNVVAVQPNIDPYNEQFYITPTESTSKLIHLAEQKVDYSTQFVITPESTIQEYLFEDNIDNSTSLNMISSYIQKYPKLAFITGISSRAVLPKGTTTHAMREFKDTPGIFYECYNTAVLIDGLKPIQLLHKSKLTPGVEIIPYEYVMPFIKKLTVENGGTSGSLGVDKERTIFHSRKTQTHTGTVICYESIYGEFVSKYTQKGAELLFIITNDGWWDDSPGYQQHFEYARLRAIENRKWVARSANTGISGFINPRGDIIQKTKYWEPDVIKETLYANSRQTVYTLYGDFIARICSVASIFMLLLTLVYGRLLPRKY